ncbi:ATP-binding cassette sub-family F member 3-like [Tubulanus polymorphus]|uniref:ATP-binding cassette sub-family F member 3-like n=1 Tax=Tubulanus polymorphus TaxID=672921 RepID=UPI003DA619B9
MAASSTYMKIISEFFPTIDGEIYQYVNGVLDTSAEHFDTSDDVYDAIGDVLKEVDEDKTDEEIMKLCDRMINIMKGGDLNSGAAHKALDAPIHLGQLAENMANRSEETASIWLVNKDRETQVDQKKLEKAEAKLRQKQQKVDVPVIKPVSNGDMASASQMSDRKVDRMETSGSNKTYDIRIENFDISYGDKKLLIGADMNLNFGRRYGLIGRNGKGKTTLLRMLSNGSLRIPSHITALHVEQEVVGDDTIALESVLESDEKRHRLLTEERSINNQLNEENRSNSKLSSRLAEIYHELEAMEADKAPAKAAVILSGLSFTPDMQKQCTKEFSGGWRMRLALARALFSKPDLLLLDEPTNMLDMKAIIWLENYLQTWPTTILVVSHDRTFLNSVTTDILHLHSQRLDAYRGDYEVFVKTRTEKLKNQQREYEAQKVYRDSIQVFIDRFRYNANRASQVQSKIKLLEKLPELKPLEKDQEVILRFPETDKLSPPVLQLDEASFYYSQDKVIFKDVCISACSESRICIVGENGAGKTTLLKILLGELDPVSGIRHGHRNLRIGYFSQHHVDQLDMNVTSIELLASRFPGLNSEAYRHQLGSFGVSGELATRSVASLSGGQKSRVAFSAMCMSNPNFFILDEPTNHLDVETIEALGKALNKFQGGVILVSHDERLIRNVCKELWVCKDRCVRSIEGGFDEYKKLVEEELAALK